MKARNLSELRAWLRDAISETQPQQISWNDPLSDYVMPDQAAIDSFVERLNHREGFRSDEMDLRPGDVPYAPKVNDLMLAIVLDYARRGQEVVLWGDDKRGQRLDRASSSKQDA